MMLGVVGRARTGSAKTARSVAGVGSMSMSRAMIGAMVFPGGFSAAEMWTVWPGAVRVRVREEEAEVNGSRVWGNSYKGTAFLPVVDGVSVLERIRSERRGSGISLARGCGTWNSSLAISPGGIVSRTMRGVSAMSRMRRTSLMWNVKKYGLTTLSGRRRDTTGYVMRRRACQVRRRERVLPSGTALGKARWGSSPGTSAGDSPMSFWRVSSSAFLRVRVTGRAANATAMTSMTRMINAKLGEIDMADATVVGGSSATGRGVGEGRTSSSNSVTTDTEGLDDWKWRCTIGLELWASKASRSGPWFGKSGWGMRSRMGENAEALSVYSQRLHGAQRTGVDELSEHTEHGERAEEAEEEHGGGTSRAKMGSKLDSLAFIPPSFNSSQQRAARPKLRTAHLQVTEG
ncbi:hypothetical protein FB45DRAFT_931516 [Roridomyces roridus]|uniref:Uncharacterized protein n=1 Tax=Roridomyces roridus TaxID=1738132 RepID=A0AAD7BEE1_9AGAR|nr:hypothetical protein FB45DRAFT_931516 [Roridomyces roridus]